MQPVDTLKDEQKLEEAFEVVETEKMGEGAHEKYHAIAEELTG
mgnify:CR=1 FL=1